MPTVIGVIKRAGTTHGILFRQMSYMSKQNYTKFICKHYSSDMSSKSLGQCNDTTLYNNLC